MDNIYKYFYLIIINNTYINISVFLKINLKK